MNRPYISSKSVLNILLITLSLILINVISVRSSSAGSIDESEFIGDRARICGQLKIPQLRGARNYLSGITFDQAFLKIRCSGYDLMGMIIEDMSMDKSKWLRLQIKNYFENETPQPENYSRLLLKGAGGKDIFTRINLAYENIRLDYKAADLSDKARGRLARREKILIDSQSDFIEYLTKHPVPGSAKLIADQRAQ